MSRRERNEFEIVGTHPSGLIASSGSEIKIVTTEDIYKIEGHEVKILPETGGVVLVSENGREEKITRRQVIKRQQQ